MKGLALLAAGAAFVVGTVTYGINSDNSIKEHDPANYPDCVTLPLRMTNEQLTTAKCLNGDGHIVNFRDTTIDPDRTRQMGY